MSYQNFFRSFAGGEITPEAFSRLDLTRVQTGLAECTNCWVLPHGPVVNRSGTMLVKEEKDSSKKVCLIPFTYDADQSYVLEMGDGYIRIHAEGATLMTGAVPAWVTGHVYSVGDLAASGGTSYYCQVEHTSAASFATDLAGGKWYAMPADGTFEMPSPYAEADLFDIHYTQSADVLTITCRGYVVRELLRYGPADWALVAVPFTPQVAAPTGVTATNTGTGSITYKYVVTAVGEDGVEESVASSSASCTNNLSTAGNYNTVSWSAVTGAVRYNVYKEGYGAGLYGYIGQAETTSFADRNIVADIGQTPPEVMDPFSTANKSPRAVGYYGGRRWFAGSVEQPQNVWATRSGTESVMTKSLPLRDDDAIAFRVTARQASRVRHIIPMTSLLLLTSEAEWLVLAKNSDVITPTNVDYKPQSYVGASEVQPVVTSSSVVFSSDRGSRLHEMLYSWESQGYKPNDMSLVAPHLVDGYEIKQLTHSRAPHNIVWAVRSDGVLLGVTYVPGQQVLAWHKHTTINGEIESVCAIPETGGEDMLYLSVKRVINGVTKRFIERMATRRFTALEDCFFVDCGLTYEGAPVTTLSGLDHLEGETVSALADGAVVRDLTVTGGEITLPSAASKVHVGLPITATVRTLPFAVEVQGYGQEKPKNINAIFLRVKDTSMVKAGPSLDRLRPYAQRTTEPWGSPPDPVSGVIEVDVDPEWSLDGQLYIQQEDPLPVTITSMLLDFAMGG